MSSKMQLPDWDDIEDQIDLIHSLTEQNLLTEARLDAEKATLIKGKLAGSGEGKSPSATSVLATVDAEESLQSLRYQKAKVFALLKKAELQFKVMQMKVDVYRTESANQRNATLP